MEKEIIFPCGENLIAKADYGYAYGQLIEHKAADKWSESQCIERCKNCNKDRKLLKHLAEYINQETYKMCLYEDVRCIGYSQEYLDNKDKPTATWTDMNDSINGRYTIEVIFQSEEYRAVHYIKGESENSSMLTLMEIGVDDLIAEWYDKEHNLYRVFMINVRTGALREIEFENDEEIRDSIVSVRLLGE